MRYLSILLIFYFLSVIFADISCNINIDYASDITVSCNLPYINGQNTYILDFIPPSTLYSTSKCSNRRQIDGFNTTHPLNWYNAWTYPTNIQGTLLKKYGTWPNQNIWAINIGNTISSDINLNANIPLSLLSSCANLIETTNTNNIQYKGILYVTNLAPRYPVTNQAVNPLTQEYNTIITKYNFNINLPRTIAGLSNGINIMNVYNFIGSIQINSNIVNNLNYNSLVADIITRTSLTYLNINTPYQYYSLRLIQGYANTTLIKSEFNIPFYDQIWHIVTPFQISNTFNNNAVLTLGINACSYSNNICVQTPWIVIVSTLLTATQVNIINITPVSPFTMSIVFTDSNGNAIGFPTYYPSQIIYIKVTINVGSYNNLNAFIANITNVYACQGKFTAPVLGYDNQYKINRNGCGSTEILNNKTNIDKILVLLPSKNNGVNIMNGMNGVSGALNIFLSFNSDILRNAGFNSPYIQVGSIVTALPHLFKVSGVNDNSNNYTLSALTGINITDSYNGLTEIQIITISSSTVAGGLLIVFAVIIACVYYKKKKQYLTSV